MFLTLLGNKEFETTRKGNPRQLLGPKGNVERILIFICFANG